MKLEAIPPQEQSFNVLHAGLYLLGFKPRSCLRPWHTWRQSTFVYPDERAMPGSTTAFIALHEAMLQSDRCLHPAAQVTMSQVGYPDTDLVCKQ